MILESKIHYFWAIFWYRTKISLKIQPEIQKLDLKYFLLKNDKNFVRFKASKLIFEFTVYKGYFVVLHGRNRKLRLS